MKVTTLRYALIAIRFVFLLLAAGVSAACSSADSTPLGSVESPDSRLFVVLSAQKDTVPEATSKPLVARVTDASGVLKSAPVSWKSTDPTIASVSSGLVTGVTPGTAFVIASSGVVADTAEIIVTKNDLTIVVQPAAAAVALGDTVQFQATMRTRAGDIVPLGTFVWSSSDTGAARFLSSGRIQTLREGDVIIGAEALARRGEGSVKVFRGRIASASISPSTVSIYQDATQQLEVKLLDQQGRQIDGEVSWGSSDFTKAAVTQYGLVSGKTAGSVVITATSGNKTASATVNVLSKPASSLVLTLPSDTALVGVDMQATATPLDEFGQPLAGRTIAWQSANPAVATVTSTGVIRGVVAGSVNISAIADGLVATKKVTVVARQARAIAISPNSLSVLDGRTAQLSAVVTDQLGTPMSQPISWVSDDPAVAAVSTSGLVTGEGAGSTQISASSGTLSSTMTVTVENVPVASVAVSPVSVTLVQGQQALLEAVAYASDQSALPGRAATWSSSNVAVATVSASGVVTALAEGAAIVSATVEGKSASAAVTVNALPPAPVADVMVTLSATTLDAGQTSQATALLKDAAGNILTGRSIAWSSLDAAVATVSGSGLVTAVGGGTVAIVAKSEGVVGSAAITVNTPPPAAVASIELEVSDQELNVGDTVKTSVTLRDTQGNTLTDRTITYWTDNPSILTVSATGIVTGVGLGGTSLHVASGSASAQKYMEVHVPPDTTPATQTVASIAVSASNTSLLVGETTQATAIARDSSGATVAGTQFTWTTSNPASATVSASGVIAAVGAGSATIMASAAGKTGSLSVTVTRPPAATVVQVTVSLSPSAILLGGTSQASAVAKDAQGTILSGRTVTWSVGDGSINSSGVLSGQSAGTTTVTASVDGVSGSAALTVSAPPPPSGGSSPAELPRVYLNFPYPTRTGQTIVVGPGGNLQNALNSAQRGDEIVLTAGATYSGNFVLPAKNGTAANGWITIRSDLLDQLPAVGTRVSPALASLMPKIITPNTSPAIRTTTGTSGWRMAGLEVTVSSTLTNTNYGLIALGEFGSAQSTLASVPSDLVLDRMYIHGQTTSSVQRCVALNSARTQVTDSYITECHGKGFDTQAIWGGNGPGPYKIVNNRLEGAGENIMFGGADPTIQGLVPSDIELRRNYIHTPIAWKGTWTKKNLLEFKNAARVLVEANVFDGSWTDAQTGWAVLMRSSNQSGNCNWCRTTDVTFRLNLIRNAGGGVNIGPTGALGNTDTTARRIHVVDNVLDNLAITPYTGDRRGFHVFGGVTDVTVERNVLSGNLQASMLLDAGMGGALRAAFRDNVWAFGSYGVICSGHGGGEQALNDCAPGYAWSNMDLVGPSRPGYPTGTTFIASETVEPLAVQVRALVSGAVSGVDVP